MSGRAWVSETVSERVGQWVSESVSEWVSEWLSESVGQGVCGCTCRKLSAHNVDSECALHSFDSQVRAPHNQSVE